MILFSKQLCALMVAAALFGFAKPVAAQADPELMRKHLFALASDEFEGRGAGQSGYTKAANYVAVQFEALGLEPIQKNGSWFQQVPMIHSTVVADTAKLEITHADGSVSILKSDQVIGIPTGGDGLISASASSVYLGYALNEDLVGVDIRGKFVVVLDGAPPGLSHDQTAHLGHRARKLDRLTAMGAAGVILVRSDEARAPRPWEAERRLAARGRSQSRPFPRIPVVLVRPSDLISSALLTAELDAAPSLANVGIKMSYESRVRLYSDANVVALAKGRTRNCVTLGAHLDHLGVSPTGEVYPGVVDNASGVAAILEVARLTKKQRKRSHRCTIFVAYAAEELGLAGSDYFVRNATELRYRISANINVDGPFYFMKTRDLTLILDEYSNMANLFDRAAKSAGFSRSRSPFENTTVLPSSDHYAYLLAGIPAVVVTSGLTAEKDGNMGKAIADYIAARYHQPADNLKQGLDFDAAAQFADRLFAITSEAANTRQTFVMSQAGKALQK